MRTSPPTPRYPGQLALQYWLYYVFNDWNNTHEGDWENIQLLFDADDARQALAREPVSVGYSQHEGSEEATWGEDKLELVDGTHPVVYPAAGSHANFFESALYLGSSAQQGVGCDDTSGPSSRSARSCERFRAIRPRPAPCSRGLRSRGAGVSFSRRSSTAPPAPTSRPRGPSRSACRRTGAIGATPSRQAVPSGRRPPTSSAVRSLAARTLFGDLWTTRFRSCWPSERCLRSFSSGSRAQRGGRPRRSAWHAAARGADPHGRSPHVRQTPMVVPRHRPRAVADLSRRDAPAGDRHPCVEHRGDLDRGRGWWGARVPRLRDRNCLDAARPQPGRRGHRPGAGGDRARQADRADRRLSAGVRQGAATVRCDRDLSHRGFAPRELRRARPDRRLAGRPLGACRVRGRARGSLGNRCAATKSPPRPRAVAEGRIATRCSERRSLSSSARSSAPC